MPEGIRVSLVKGFITEILVGGPTQQVTLAFKWLEYFRYKFTYFVPYLCFRFITTYSLRILCKA